MEEIDFNEIGKIAENVNTDKVSIDESKYIHNEYSAVVYMSKKIEQKYENNFRSIMCVKDIDIGELLMIEHVYSAPHNVAIYTIAYNKEVYEGFYPRNSSWEDKTDILKQAQEKLSHNCFGTKNKNFLFNNVIYQINHSCTASCGVYISHEKNIQNTDIIFMELYSIKKIKAGEEIFINYGPSTAHTRDFTCLCGIPEEKRNKIFSVGVGIVKSLSIKYNENINKKIFKYASSTLFKKILLYQYLSVNGIYINNGVISGFTEEGAIIINKLLSKFMETDENMTNEKLRIFLYVIEKLIIDNILEEKIESKNE